MSTSTNNATTDVLSEFALTRESVPHGSAEKFFNGLPRFSLAMPKYDALTQYALDLATSAGIAIIALVVVLFFFFVLLLVRQAFCLRKVFDRKQVIRRDKEGKENVKHLLLSTVLLHTFLAAMGIGIIGAVVLAESSLNIWSSTDALVTDMRRTGISLMDFMVWVRAQFVAFDAKGLNDGTEKGEFLSESFGTLKDYIPPRFPDVQALRMITKELLDNILGIIDMLAHNVRWMFTAMMALTLVSFLGIIIRFATGMFSKRRTCCIVLLELTYLLIPLLFTWIFFAVWTGAGIGVADGCRMVGEYREFLKTGTQTNTSLNVLMDTKLVCPPPDEAAKLIGEMKAAKSAVLDNPLAADTMAILLGNIDSQDLDKSTAWATDQAIEFINCNVLLRFSGRLESIACGDRATSVISGIRYLWWSSLLGSIAISALFLAGIFNSPVIWAGHVWAPPKMDESFLEGEVSGSSGSDDYGGKASQEDGDNERHGNSEESQALNGEIDAMVASD